MNPRIVFALAAAVLFASTPAMAGASRPADTTPPMLTLNQLAKVCVDADTCGPTYYVDWDGKIYRESNKKLNLQRSDTLDGVNFVKRDATDLLP